MANLRNTNLNLFLVFQALMKEQHLTRAGESIGLSQPGMSYSLKHLREIFNDPLFVKNNQSMIPTEKALLVFPDIQASLRLLSEAVDKHRIFDPATADTHFNLGLTDYATMVFLPELYKKVNAKAPSLEFTIHSVSTPEKSGALDKGEIDLAVGVFDNLPSRLEYHELYQEKIVMIYDPKRIKIKNKFTLKQFLDSPHVLLDFRESPPLTIKKHLQKKNLKRKVAFTLPQVLTIGRAIKNTNLIAAIPLTVAKRIAKQENLALADLPFKLPTFYVCLVWHKRKSQCIENKWLRDMFIEVNAEALKRGLVT
jgi:DNA-binding transcriptional LysR family regulator